MERHRIKIPTLKYVRLKEYGYLPTDTKVINGSVSENAGRFYVSVTVEKEAAEYKADTDFIVLSIKITDKNPEKLQKKLNLQKRRLQRKNGSANKRKELLKIKKTEQKINRIKKDYLNKQIASIIKMKPEYLIMEDLNINTLKTDRQIKKLTVKQKYYDLKNRLLIKCSKYNIELKQIDTLENKAEKTVQINII